MSSAPGLLIPRRHNRRFAPLCAMQEPLWLSETLRPGQGANVLSVAARAPGSLNLKALGEAMRQVARRHEALRARIRTDGADVFQQFDAEPLVQLQTADLREVRELDPLAKALRFIQAERLKPFDLSREHGLRLAAARLAEDETLVVLSVHHLIADAWALGLVAGELSTAFAALEAGEASPFVDEAPQYGDYCAWERRRRSEPAFIEAVEDWRRRLAGAAPVDLTGGAAARRAGDGGHCPLELDAELVARLRRAGASISATPFTVLVAGLAALLGKRTGSNDICIGVPSANRRRAGTPQMVGMFVNMLAVRITLDPLMTVADLLEAARRAVIDAFSRDDVPIKIPGLLAGSRAGEGLLNVVLNLQNARDLALAGRLLPGAEPIELVHESPRADLEVYLEDAGAGLRGHVGYRQGLFDRGDIEELIRQWRAVLMRLADSEATIGSIELLDEGTRGRLLQAWRGPAPPALPSVVDMVADQARRRPDAAAVVDDHGVTTYRDLERRSEELAGELQDRGLPPEAIVAVHLPPTADFVVALLAVLRSGGAYLPLDPELPEPRIRFMIEDCEAAAIITSDDRGASFKDSGVPVLRPGAGRRPGGATPGRPPTPNSLAYAIYTSGSTGAPKAALLEHAALANVVRSLAEGLDVKPGDQVLQFAHVGFDAATAEIWVALCHGATLHMAEPARRLPGRPLAELIRERGIRQAILPPVALPRLEPYDVACLRQVMVAGEACPEAVVRRWAETVRLVNGYGPTEATICATWEALGVDDAGALGRPIPGAWLYAMDGGGAISAPGCVGELWIGGIGVARGYHGREALTRAHFVPDPYVASARAFRTGDRVRVGRDGDLQFVGRTDRRIKLRGHRIEPAEIERVLEQNFAVARSIVRCEGEERDAHLVAYVEPKAGARITSTELRALVRRHLPAAFVPRAVVIVEALPLSASGKLDASRLPPATEPAGEAAAPRTPAEIELAALWRDLLACGPVGLHDDFFELGGDSLAAVELVELAFRRGWGLRIGDIFDAPTLQEVAARAEPVEPDVLDT